MYYVYIIESSATGIFYKRSAADYLKRLKEYNEGLSTYTKGKGPWKLIFVEVFDFIQEALTQEKKLKMCNKEYLRWLLCQPQNILFK
jgi:putative endonuclease